MARDTIPDLEQRQRDAGIVSFAYRSEKDTTVEPYTSITFLAPDNAPNKKALGYDMYSQSDRR